jgi:hypothetical protein
MNVPYLSFGVPNLVSILHCPVVYDIQYFASFKLRLEMCNMVV